jgi:hypothetical protein
MQRFAERAFPSSLHMYELLYLIEVPFNTLDHSLMSDWWDRIYARKWDLVGHFVRLSGESERVNPSNDM